MHVYVSVDAVEHWPYGLKKYQQSVKNDTQGQYSTGQ